MRIPPPSQGIGAHVIGDELRPSGTEVSDCARPQPALSLTAQQIRKGRDHPRQRHEPDQDLDGIRGHLNGTCAPYLPPQTRTSYSNTMQALNEETYHEKT